MNLKIKTVTVVGANGTMGMNVSDLVFESAAENLELKIDLHTKIGKALRKDAIAGTGSSGLSITRLAECYPEDVRGQFFGIHILAYALRADGITL